MSFAAATHLAEGLSYRTAHNENGKFSYLPCGHTNINGVGDGIAI
jgi:hypothetical protein